MFYTAGTYLPVQLLTIPLLLEQMAPALTVICISIAILKQQEAQHTFGFQIMPESIAIVAMQT